MQSTYIADNPNPLGSKDQQNSYDDGSSYSLAHKSFHPGIRTFLQAFGYYDIFIVDPSNGNVVYSVFKEMDYGTSLENGPYKDSGLAEAYRNAKGLEHGQSKFTQFEPYTPSYESPAAFISSPIMNNGTLSGILIFQMPVDAINNMMTFNGKWKENGMGDSAEIYLVDRNKKIINNSRFYVEDQKGFFNLMNSIGFNKQVIDDISDKGTNIGLLPVNSPGVDDALKGNTGYKIFNDYRNVSVVSAYTHVNAGDLGWVILSEVDASEAYAAVETLRSSIIINVSAFTALALIFASFIGWRIALSATKPIESISKAVQVIAGNSDFTLEVPESGDTEIHTLASSVNKLVHNLNQSIGNVKKAVNQLQDSSGKMAKMANEMSHNIKIQESECSQVATAATELQSTATEVAKNAANTAEETTMANNTAQTTQSIVKVSNQASIKLADELTLGKDILSRVAQESEQISAVLDVINGIAEQTNLLALNAAIEAARAGEQGRGFAVVADEVRQLAKRTQTATTEIEQMISNLQSSSTEAVKAIDQGNLMADESLEHSNNISESLEKVASIVIQITDMNTQVATASEEQTAVVAEISHSVNNISDAASDNSERSSELTSTADQLLEMSSKLHKAVSRYII